MLSTKILFKKIHPDAELPTKAYKLDAGMDFKCIESFTINSSDIKVISTGLCCELEEGFELQIRPRSGNAIKGLTIVNSPGTIDAGYRGEIKVILHNVGKQTLTFEKGDKIAQGIVSILPYVQIKLVNELSDSQRGEGGFGSSGN